MNFIMDQWQKFGLAITARNYREKDRRMSWLHTEKKILKGKRGRIHVWLKEEKRRNRQPTARKRDYGERRVRIVVWAVVFLCTGYVSSAQESSGKINVRREVYIKQTVPGQTRWASVDYIDAGLTREETHTFMAQSDTPESPKRRWSTDNGRTWSEFVAVPEAVTHEQGARIYWGRGPMHYDVQNNVLVSIWLRQTKTELYANHSFSRISRDGGRSWSEPKQLTYEDGAHFDSNNPLAPDYLAHNQSYFGNNIIRHSNGTLIHAGAAVNVPYENEAGKSYHAWVPADAKNIGSRCFLGHWNSDSKDYTWTAGKPVWVPLETSSRGLMEPDVVELNDGRVLIVWRGSNTPVTQGRKWFSLSEDTGQTLSPVQEWKYDDGTRFYSPSSIHRFHRDSNSGKLYWFGNISPGPPKANSPRYPLVVAEVDESIPAIKRDTVTIVDDRGPDDSSKLQLSNFCLLENRETDQVELYMTRLVPGKAGAWSGDAFKYTISFD